MSEEALLPGMDRLTNIAALLHAVPGGIFIYTADSAEQFLFVSENMLNFLGYTQNEFSEKFNNKFSQMIYADDRQRVLQEIDAQIARGDFDSCEYRIERKDGSLVWVHDEGHRVEDRQGQPYFYVVIVDITESVMNFDRSMQELLVSNPQALCTFRLNLTKDVCMSGHGSSAYVLHLLQADTVRGLFSHVAAIITDEGDQQLFQQRFCCHRLLESFHSGQARVSCTYRRRTEDEDSHWVKTLVQMVQNPQTGDVEAVMYSLDINEEKKEELIVQRLAAQEYDFVALLDVQRQTIEIRTAGGESVCQPQQPYSPDCLHVIERDVLPADRELCRQQASLENLIEQLAVQDSYVYVYTQEVKGNFLRKQLQFCWLDDAHRYILAAQSDITVLDRREKERMHELQAALLAAERANEAKSAFLSSMSHDMRTPLNGIIGFTELALRENTSAKVADYLGKIKISGSLLLSLINDTLQMSKIESGKFVLEPAVVKNTELLEDIVVPIRAAAEAKKVHFVVQAEGVRSESVWADRLSLQKIFLNLLSNAVKFTPAGGEVYFEVEHDTADGATPEDYRITVRDTGRGISAEFLPQIFEPFAQESGLSAQNPQGTGLGLSIVRRLVDFMGGRIEVASALGKGTEFRVFLRVPRAADVVASPDPKKTAKISLAGRHILLCEDNALNTEIARTILEAEGIEVSCAANGAEGVRLFEQSAQGDFAGILMDLRMPVMTGYEAAAAIRALPRRDALSVPILAMTADAYAEDVAHCLAVGMNGHVPKPIDPVRLFRELERLLRGRK